MKIYIYAWHKTFVITFPSKDIPRGVFVVVDVGLDVVRDEFLGVVGPAHQTRLYEVHDFPGVGLAVEEKVHAFADHLCTAGGVREPILQQDLLQVVQRALVLHLLPNLLKVFKKKIKKIKVLKYFI